MIVSEEDIIAEFYDKRLNKLKKGVYGKFIKDNNDGTYTIHDGTREVDMRIDPFQISFCNTYTTYPCKWIKALPIIPIKDLRHEQLYFENRTQMPYIDGIFESPNYFSIAKNRTAKIMYWTPIEYMELVARGFKSTLSKQIKYINKKRVEQYANDMLKGDLFPMVNIMYYEDGSIDQEGRHRAMAIQYLIDKGKIPEDTEIPVAIVREE